MWGKHNDGPLTFSVWKAISFCQIVISMVSKGTENESPFRFTRNGNVYTPPLYTVIISCFLFEIENNIPHKCQLSTVTSGGLGK